MRDQVQHVIPALALAAGCVMLFGMQEQQRLQPRAHMVALDLPVTGYGTKDVTIDSAERKIAGMDDYVYRVFQRDTADLGFSIYVGYYTFQEQGKSIHSPKNCLPGAGWETLQGGTRAVPVEGGGSPVFVNRYVMANKGAQALVYYWYQGRGRVESSEYVVKWNLLKDAAVHGRTEEALVRLVIPLDMAGLRPGESPDARYAAADSLAGQLASRLVPRVGKLLPEPPST